MNELLKRAVRESNLASVKSLLSRGACANVKVQCGAQSLLHIVRRAEIAEELLLHGALVNSKNSQSRTPLFNAIMEVKGLEFVRVLIKYGAHVNARDRNMDTPLHSAVRRGYPTSQSEVIKELLWHGADINKRNLEYQNSRTPLDIAVDCLELGQLLIKITLLKNFQGNFRQIINLSPYKNSRFYNELSNFLEDCISEANQMKADNINESLSLYQFIISEKVCPNAVCRSNVGGKSVNDEVFVILNSNDYHVYHDTISDKINNCLRDVPRETLLNTLGGLKMYTESDLSNKGFNKERATLDYYSTNKIGEYLSNNELLSLLTAFHKHPGKSSGPSTSSL